MSQEKEAQKKFYKTHDDKEPEKAIALENKIKILDDIVYKTGQSVQTMNMLNRNCKTSFVKPEYLKKAQRANPHLYDIDQVVKCERLEKELLKNNITSKCFEALQQHAIDLELALQQRVIPTTSVSRPQLKSNRLEDKVIHNNSQGKKQQVEDHRRNFKFSNNKMYVTACNDSLNAKTLNRTVAAESTNQIPRSIIRKQYDQISKICRWWCCKITPLGYKWKLKSKTVNVEPNVSMHLGTKSRTTNILEPTNLRKSTVSNTPSSSNSFIARRDNFIDRRLWVLKAHDEKSQASKGLHAQVRIVQIDKDTKFLNKTLHAYFAQEGIEHQTSTARTPEQNGIVERQNRTLVEAARTMLSAAKVPLFF
nr:putative RNA-directed DNA polymerase [Tanacetum cinerariifolium]